ncbi:hypothetical protein ACFY3M_53115 [Streptomyces mirabilis]
MSRADYETLSAAIAESDVDDQARRALAFGGLPASFRPQPGP